MLVVVAAIVLVPGLGSLRDRFAGAQPGWLVLAAVLQLGSCASYVLVFRGVFCRRMSWRTSTEIGLSELAANSLFSIGGAGGLALGAWILRRGGLPAGIHRPPHGGVLPADEPRQRRLPRARRPRRSRRGAAARLAGRRCSASSRRSPACSSIALALAARRLAGALAGARCARGSRARREAVGDGVDEALRLLRTGDLALLVGAAGYMLFDVAMLGVCFAAFGNDVPPVGVLLVAYIIGQLGGLIPIPGGIGGVDGGLIGTLVLYGVDATDAAVAVIAYRGLLLAIPALLGLPALAVLRRRLRDEAHDIAACAPGRVGRGARPRPLVHRPEPATAP